MKKTKEGISLIVLVITIIVMIILAAAIIISLNNTGIIGNSNKAVDETNKKTVQEITNLAWGEAYADGVRSVDKLKEAVEKALENNNLNPKDYGINVTENGVDIAKGWLQTKNYTVVKGDYKLEIGDVIYYHDKADNGLEKYTDGWKVLGAENGKLLIVSTKKVDSKKYHTESSLEKYKELYQNEVDRLNEECSIYGTGEGAIGARSIKTSDIDKVTGYNKQAITYANGTLAEPGNEITFYWQKGSNYPYYETSNGLKGNLEIEYTSFVWFDNNNEYHIMERPTNQTEEKQKICTITVSYYYYEVVTTDKLEANKQIFLGSPKAYKMLFEDEIQYMLADRIIAYKGSKIYYNIRHIYKNTISSIIMLQSDSSLASVYDTTNDIRAVVTLKDDVNLTGSSASGWGIASK